MPIAAQLKRCADLLTADAAVHDCERPVLEFRRFLQLLAACPTVAPSSVRERGRRHARQPHRAKELSVVRVLVQRCGLA